MHFSLDLIDFSGVDSLHIIFFSGAIRCINSYQSGAHHTFSGRRHTTQTGKRPQAVSLIWSQAECVNARICSNFFSMI